MVLKYTYRKIIICAKGIIMKNRFISIIIMILLVISIGGCGSNNSSAGEESTEKVSGKELHKHMFSHASCTEASTCSCGEVKGEPLGHDMTEATCLELAKCKVCGFTQGELADHKYMDGCCEVCGAVDPDSIPVGLHEVAVIDSEYGYKYNSGSMKDNFGNTYVGYHFFKENNNIASAIFNINAEYSKFVCDIVLDESTYKADSAIQIYVDDNMVFEKSGITKTTGIVHVEVDITNGKQLKIVGVENNFSSSYVASLVNAQLYK